jgi:hypothetical protein
VIETYFTAPRVLDRMRSGPMAPCPEALEAAASRLPRANSFGFFTYGGASPTIGG